MDEAHHGKPGTERTPLGRHEIELRMLAIRDHVPGLRTLIADWAVRENHNLDFLDDVRLALDEACAIMLANCVPSDMLDMRLLVSRHHVEIAASVRLPDGAEPSVGGLTLPVLQALADSLDYRISETETGRYFRLCLSRSEPSGLRGRRSG